MSEIKNREAMYDKKRGVVVKKVICNCAFSIITVFLSLCVSFCITVILNSLLYFQDSADIKGMKNKVSTSVKYGIERTMNIVEKDIPREIRGLFYEGKKDIFLESEKKIKSKNTDGSK